MIGGPRRLPQPLTRFGGFTVDVDAISKLIGNFGFPIVLVLMLAFAGWRVLVWLGPRVDKMIDGHVKFLETMETHIKCEEEVNARLESGISRMAAGLEALAQSWNQLRDKIAAKGT